MLLVLSMALAEEIYLIESGLVPIPHLVPVYSNQKEAAETMAKYNRYGLWVMN